MLDKALRQLQRIETFCDHCARLPMPPVTVPPDPVRAAGLDADLWHGLGIVGLWAAIDAFAERRQQGGYAAALSRLAADRPKDLGRIAKELDDMRHLYAHNFAGVADAIYFRRPKRHVFRAGVSYRLASGGQFNGHQLTLTLDDLRFYIGQARDVLKYLDNAWL